MAAPTSTSARGPEAEHATATLNEPSMEDILASIRRIIAEDQSHGLARGGLPGLTRRTAPAEPPAAETGEAGPRAAGLEPPPTAEAAVEPDAVFADETGPESPFGHAVAPEPDALVPEPHAVFPAMDGESYHTAAEGGAVPGHLPQSLEVSRDEDVVAGAEPLMSPTAGASITSSFHALAESVVLQDTALVERVLRETMRPLLKEWLDDHLPSIVERLVRAEIERVARGGRGRD